MKVSVKKLSHNPNTFGCKLDQLDIMPVKPEVGKSLTLYSSEADCYKGGIITSKVKEVIEVENMYTVRTINSTYQIKVLEE